MMILVYALLLLPLMVSAANSTCQMVCGTTTVSYPFGFSEGCGIRLNCNDGYGSIGDFRVQNVTNENILLSFPAQCNRSMGDLGALFDSNFAPTSRNAFLFENCSETFNQCLFSNDHLSSISGVDCIGSRPNASCYFSDNSSVFMDRGSVMTRGRNCGILLSSVMLNSKNGTEGQPITVNLNLRTVELGWWVSGTPSCDPNANFTTVIYGNNSGYRCNCNNGFTGDGFAAGAGCRRVSCGEGGHGCVRVKASTLVAGIAAGASFMAALILIYFYLKRRSAALRSRLSAKRLIDEAAGGISIPFYTFKDIEKATNGFSEKQRLGTGAYGTVYAGYLHNGDCLAIKRIRYRDHDGSEQVMNEIKLLSSVSHPNLVQLLGCCIEDREQILVYEFMPNGTLAQHLQRERGDSALPWAVRLNIAAETANGIAYLHSQMNPPIYHRDIKSSNILLDHNFNSKVADFGLSRVGMMDDSHVSTTPQGTPGYVDPQYHQNFHLSDKSDVYSFGVVLVEIITAMKAVDFSRPNSDVTLAALAVERIGKGRIEEIIDPFLEPNTDAWTLSSLHQVAELAFRCLAFHREMRPSMIEVAEELNQIRNRRCELLEETLEIGSSRTSCCSATFVGSEKCFSKSSSKKSTVVGSRRIIPMTVLPTISSPVSVQDSWLSLHSSISTNSLLYNIV